MKLNDPHIQMLVNPRALKLNDVLEIINAILYLKEDIEIFRKNLIDDDEFEKDLVDSVRDINKLNKYINLSEIEFAKKIIEISGYKTNVSPESIESLFNSDYEEDVDEFPISFTTVSMAIPPSKDFAPKIIDFSKSINYNAYTEHPIAYDFIVKMQQKLWDGILDTYLNSYIRNEDTDIYSVQRYDRDLIYSTMLFPKEQEINIYFFKENLINWAMAQGFIVTSDDINVIDDVKNNQVIICISFAL